jgi:hypothetical protein
MESTDDLKITLSKEFMYLLSQQSNLFDRIDWPVLIMPMSFDYIAKPELLDAPHMKKTHEDDKLLCQLFPEVCLTDVAKKSMLLPAFKDIFTDAMYPVWKEGKVSMRSVSAARVHLDILDLCSDSNGKQLLQEEGRRQNDYFKFYLDSEGHLDVRSGLRWSIEDEPLMRENNLRKQIQTFYPAFSEFKGKLSKIFDEGEAKRPKQRMVTEDVYRGRDGERNV